MPYLKHLVKDIKERFRQFEESFPQQENEPDKEYIAKKREYCKKIYLTTKAFFDDYQDVIPPIDKMIVLEEYINLWIGNRAVLDISDTDFADIYKNTVFRLRNSKYDENVPMMAGFNLKNIQWGEFQKDKLIFPSVDFRGADFNDVSLNDGGFHHCHFTNSKIGNGRFDGGLFVRCNLDSVDLSKSFLWGNYFIQCITHRTAFPHNPFYLTRQNCFSENLFTAVYSQDLNLVSGLVEIFPELLNICDRQGNTPLHSAAMGEEFDIAKVLIAAGAKVIKNAKGETPFDIANDRQDVPMIELLKSKPKYPFFLKHLKVKLNALTPEKVAHALWLSDKDHRITEAYKFEFRLWTKRQALSFGEADVEKCLSRFVMK